MQALLRLDRGAAQGRGAASQLRLTRIPCWADAPGAIIRLQPGFCTGQSEGGSKELESWRGSSADGFSSRPLASVAIHVCQAAGFAHGNEASRCCFALFWALEVHLVLHCFSRLHKRSLFPIESLFMHEFASRSIRAIKRRRLW